MLLLAYKIKRVVQSSCPELPYISVCKTTASRTLILKSFFKIVFLSFENTFYYVYFKIYFLRRKIK